MARSKSNEQAKSRIKATAIDDINRGIDKLKDLMAQVEDLTREGHPYKEAVLARTDLSIRESIRRIFGEKSTEYQTHKVHKLRTNSRGESAQTTTVLKKLVAQLEDQKREFLGLNPRSDPSTSPSSEKVALKTVPSVTQITLTPPGPSTPATAPITLSVAMTTNLTTLALPTSRLPLPAADNEQQPSCVQEALPAPVGTPMQSAGESVSSSSTANGGTCLDRNPSIQPDTFASVPSSSSPSTASLHDPLPSSTEELTAVSHPSTLPSHPTPHSGDDPPYSSPRNSPDIPQQTPTPMISAITQSAESIKPQIPQTALETEGILRTPASRPRSTPSSTSGMAVAVNKNRDTDTSLAPVQIVASPSLDHSETTSTNHPSTQPVFSPQPLAYAGDVNAPISSGSSADDLLIRSDDPTNPVQTIESRRDDPLDPLQVVRKICSRFHLVTRQLRVRKDDRPSLQVEDEYDVQDLMHALLLLEFEEVQPDERRPSYAKGKTQTSYLLHPEKAVIVVKKTKAGVTTRDLSEEVTADSSIYSSRTDCETLFCFIYDPEGRIGNPRALEAELTMVSDGYTVEVIIAPK